MFHNFNGFSHVCFALVELSEEWSLATSMKDFAVNSDDIDTDSEEPDTFDVKYLGCTIIEAVRSEEATAEAVKSVILTAKGTVLRKAIAIASVY